MKRRAVAPLALCGTVLVLAASPAPAAANPLKPICNIAGWLSGVVGKACTVVQHSDRIVSAGKKLLSGHVGSAVKTLLSGGASKVGVAATLVGVGAWVMVGAKSALEETSKLISRTTTPQLGTTWFSSTYWRVAALAAVLTLPFLFAAAVQAVIRSDLALLAHAVFGYLPLAVLGVSIAAPVAMLLLSASDEMSAVVSATAGGDGTRFLGEIGVGIGAASTLAGSPFLAFLLGLLLVAGAVVLWLELLIREAAVYVVVLMLPLAFASLVWPARRIWAIRAIELLIALILAKFAIVAVLTLAAAALGHKILAGPDAMFSGLALVTLAALAPWALVRLLPMTEVAGAAAGPLRQETRLGQRGDQTERTAELAENRAVERAGASNGDGREAAREAALAHSEGFAEMSRREGDPAARNGAPTSNGAGPVSSRAAPEPSASEPAASGSPAPESGQRLPGFPDLWQGENGSWDPIIFDPSERLGRPEASDPPEPPENT